MKFRDLENLENEGADRYQIQEALMPYKAILPERYRGKNERLWEK